MSDYMAESPLWSTNDMLLPDELGLSPALAAAIDDWQSHFEAHFAHETGWDSLASREWYRLRAPDLVGALMQELPVGSQVDVNLWPLTGGD